MINLTVDESFAIDYYSILEVKTKKTHSNDNIENFNLCFLNLEKELGEQVLLSILVSNEYQDLFDVNLEIFEILDKAKKQPKSIYIEKADTLNYRRFELKQLIQKKFFNNRLNETKIGYGK